MAQNNNGFEDALKTMKTLLAVDKNVALDVLEEAADYFSEKLKPRINLSNKSKRTHLRNSLKVVVEGDVVRVVFEDAAWYWHLADKGHKKRGGRGRVKGLHFVQNTFDGESGKIADIMAEKIINRMEG